MFRVYYWNENLPFAVTVIGEYETKKEANDLVDSEWRAILNFCMIKKIPIDSTFYDRIETVDMSDFKSKLNWTGTDYYPKQPISEERFNKVVKPYMECEQNKIELEKLKSEQGYMKQVLDKVSEKLSII